VGDASLRAQTASACCFSLLTRGGRSVDLEADTPRQKLEWIYGVRGENASSNKGISNASGGATFDGRLVFSSFRLAALLCCRSFPVLMGAIGRAPKSVATVAPLLKQPVARSASSKSVD